MLSEAFTPSCESLTGENQPYGMAWNILEDGDIIAHSGGWLGIAAHYVVNVVPMEDPDGDEGQFDRLREMLVAATR